MRVSVPEQEIFQEDFLQGVQEDRARDGKAFDLKD